MAQKDELRKYFKKKKEKNLTYIISIHYLEFTILAF